MAARARVKVIKRDRGWDKIRKQIKQDPLIIAVGIQGKEALAKAGGEEDGLTVAEVAAVNEFGMGVPERSFLRSTIDAGEAKYKGLLRGIGNATVAGKITLVRGAKIVGEVVVGDVKQSIADGIPPPNAESTIVAKGSSTPLIRTGQMRGSVTSKVTASKLLGGRK